MVVVAVGGAAGAGGWGTWEELVLGGAVLRHGEAAWATVAEELRSRSRSTSVFSAEDCEAKFAEIQSRYSACDAWFEELRKQRVAQLKRELEESENSIGSLQSVIEGLSNNKHGDGSSDCHTTRTESCSHSGNRADTKAASKELSRDRSSAASFTEEASNCQKSQQVQRCDTDSIKTNNTSTEESFLKGVDAKVCTKDNLFWGSRKQRGGRVRRILQNSNVSSRDSEPTSTGCIEKDGSSEVCENIKKGLNLKHPNVEPGAVKKCLKTSNAVSDAKKKGLKTPDAESGVMKTGLPTPNAESGVIKKGLKTTKLESDVMKNGLTTAKLKSGVKNGLMNPKLESGVMKNSLKTPNVESDDSVIERDRVDLAAIVKYISTQGDCLMLQRQVDDQRKRVTYKKMIRRHMDFRILHDKIKTGAISSTKELLRDMLLFVNNVIAFYPKATLEYMAAIELRDLACKTMNENANFISKTASAPMVKKNVQVTQPGRHGPSDVKVNKVPSRATTANAKGNNVPSRGTTANARQREGKDTRTRSDKPPAANLKTVQKSEPAKKRGVGRPPKSGALKRSAPALEDSPSRGRKRLRRGT